MPAQGPAALCRLGPAPPARFKFRDARTWGTPTDRLEVTDAELGQVLIRTWGPLHFRQTTDRPMTVIRIERLCSRGTRRDPRVLWLAWVGEPFTSLDEVWRLYFRRFAVDHGYRFAKQSLHWTRPHFKTPAQAERWSDLMPLLTW